MIELAEPFAMSQPAISKHLKVLERAGLISRGRDAQRRPCRLEAKPLAEADRLARELPPALGGQLPAPRRAARRAEGRAETERDEAPEEEALKSATGVARPQAAPALAGVTSASCSIRLPMSSNELWRLTVKRMLGLFIGTAGNVLTQQKKPRSRSARDGGDGGGRGVVVDHARSGVASLVARRQVRLAPGRRARSVIRSWSSACMSLELGAEMQLGRSQRRAQARRRNRARRRSAGRRSDARDRAARAWASASAPPVAPNAFDSDTATTTRSTRRAGSAPRRDRGGRSSSSRAHRPRTGAAWGSAASSSASPANGAKSPSIE